MIESKLKQIFGYDSFRPLQEEIINSVLQKQDSLVVMPTGSGKSLCYQLPALEFEGLTVVVSPLISLMEDQVMQLRALGVTAVFLNSTLDYLGHDWVADQIRSGEAKLLYAAPETLVQPRTLALLDQCNVACLTIDEAHCISEWGHDFRPEYRQLVELRHRFPDAVCLAVTATATERVRQDIKNSLEIGDAHQFVASFDRDNLMLAVEPKTDSLAQTINFLQAHPDESGIIYCNTRKQVDFLAGELGRRGWSVLPYHAGLDDATRRQNQQKFIRDDVPIMVATIAFGMGINKPNVRFVLHADLPKNLESYYQQIGRAGRDGLPSSCLLLFSYADVQTINYFIREQDPSQQQGARARLEAMLGFVEGNDCRRRPLLNYFGEAYQQENCKTCDNCTSEAGERVDLTIPAQKFLSCVKRTGEMFGVNHIIDVLRGSQSQKVLQRRHDKLSTYNIGLEFSKKEWQFLARQFVQQGLMTQDMEFGSLKLTPKAYAVFKGEPFHGTLPDKPKAAPSAVDYVNYDQTLFQQLRQRRKGLADGAGVPPYVIFSDRTLVEMATYFPQSRESFGTLYGVGQTKLTDFADEFLPVIQAYCSENSIKEVQKSSPTAVSRSSTPGGRSLEVLNLYNNGRSLPELCQQYNVKPSTIIGHLWKAVQAGETLRQNNLLEYSTLSPAQQQQALAAFAEHGPDYLRPIYDALNETVDYEELHLLRLHFLSQK